jgi:hypothetical protein
VFFAGTEIGRHCAPIEAELTIGILQKKAKKADVGEHLRMFPDVGLLFDQPPGGAGLPFT